MSLTIEVVAANFNVWQFGPSAGRSGIIERSCRTTATLGKRKWSEDYRGWCSGGTSRLTGPPAPYLIQVRWELKKMHATHRSQRNRIAHFLAATVFLMDSSLPYFAISGIVETESIGCVSWSNTPAKERPAKR